MYISAISYRRMLSWVWLGFTVGCSSAEPGIAQDAPLNEGAASPGVNAAGPTVQKPIASGVNGDELAPLAQLDVEPGHTVTIYEPSPGTLVMAESLTSAQTPLLAGPTTDALELFAQLNPGQSPPSELFAAYDRAKASADQPTIGAAQGDANSKLSGAPDEAALGTIAPLEVQQGDFASVGQALTSSSNPAKFVNEYHGCDWGSASSGCRVNWSGGFNWQVTAKQADMVVDHYSGNGVTIRLLTNGAVTFSLGVPSGQVGVLSLSGSSATRRCEVTDAANDAFHAGCRFAK